MSTVSVIGTGTMGSALARAFLAGDYEVTVWNRTRSRAERLESQGARVAGSLAEAIGASDLIVMCVATQAAADEVLEPGDVRRALRGKTLVQLTTGTAADGRRNQGFALDHQISYLDGAIMAYPRTIGTDAAVILYAGAQSAFAASQELLSALGTVRYLGEDAGQPAVADAALIAFFYGTLSGFLHGAILSRAEGIAINQYLELARPFFATFVTEAVEETGQRIVANDYGDAQSSMHTHFGGIDLLVVNSSNQAGIDASVMTAIRDWFARAIAAGRGDDDIACLVELEGGRGG
jgi:3-hydroxyisobutyrate dehydrogenase-like beta-hydroxyacid dehydrogenase